MLVKLAWRNLWRNKLRTSIMLGAMVFGLMGVVAMMGFMNGLVDSMIKNAISWQTSHLQIQQKSYLVNPELKDVIPDANEISKVLVSNREVKAISERFLADGMIASARSTRGIRINGVNIDQEQNITPLSQHIVDGEWLSEEARSPILVSSKIAERLKLRVGSKVVLTLSDVNGEVAGAAFRVRGIFKTPSTGFDDGNVYVRKVDLEKVAGLSGTHEIAILLTSNNDAELKQLLAFTHSILPPESKDLLSVRPWQEIQPLLSTMTSTMDVSNQVMLVVFVLAMTLGIINIMLMSVFERTREFGVLMAVGMQKHKIRLLIVFETLFLGLSGCALGLLGSAIMLKVLSITGLSLAGMAEGLGAYGVDTLLYPRVSIAEYQMIIVAIFVASLIAALYPARQILKHRPVDAMAEKS
ncbi:ABC transporter permease [Vibrio harveyi]|uniref:ABC transporter permease n=1 Tax=Vibrio harveyi TaxID=669 RepID=UPI0003A4B3BF|nr:FtsX-like permease family protein [Vibrio harveyi]MBY7701108.1 ABC transporter permease [Vibrio harveyi]PNM63311.1 ABC transporter permease [Vibrio harveyi]UIL55733.1 ABC transporter permease [Vibrio harveyi]SQA35608.1 ABC transporter permease [Vibrio harveyi]